METPSTASQPVPSLSHKVDPRHRRPVRRSWGLHLRSASMIGNVMYSILFVLLISMICNCVVCESLESKGESDFTPQENDNDPHRLPTECEVCRIVAEELSLRFDETGKTTEVIGREGKQKKFVDSELRFIETMEGFCDRLLTYRVHKEHKDLRRFGRGISQTMKTLDGLVQKGVKVDIGMPNEMWDKPSGEIEYLKTQCENMLEANEDVMEQWYFRAQNTPIVDYLCKQRLLVGKSKECLGDHWRIRGAESLGHREL